MRDGYSPKWLMLEGPDGSGKTTLAKTMAWELANTTGPTVLIKLRAGDPLSEYVETPDFLKSVGQCNIVQDRGVLSAAAYQPVKPHPMHPAIIEQLPLAIELGCILVHVTADPEVILHRFEERGDEYMQLDQMRAVCRSYVQAVDLWVRLGGPIHVVDTTFGFYDEAEVRELCRELSQG